MSTLESDAARWRFVRGRLSLVNDLTMDGRAISYFSVRASSGPAVPGFPFGGPIKGDALDRAVDHLIDREAHKPSTRET
jgi:hypothetical protein